MTLQNTAALSERFAAFAAMSALAYGGESDACPKSVEVEAQEEEVLLSILEDSGWARAPQSLLPICQDARGLFYQVWLRPGLRDIEVAVAFRGTEFPDRRDWRSNLKWFHRSETQYDTAREASQRVIEGIKGLFPSLRPVFFSTGHSLGGGLAQHALFAEPEVYRQAIVFNSSPVTGEKGLSKKRQCLAKRCQATIGAEGRVIMLNESGEILSALRELMRAPTSSAPPTKLQAHEQVITFDFSSGNPFTQHAMNVFAKELAGMAASPRTESSEAPSELWYASTPKCVERFERDHAVACRKLRLKACDDE